MTSVAIAQDLRTMFGPVRDQGKRPTCLAFAASDLHAALRGAWRPLSCEYLFYHAQQRSGRTARESATLKTILEAVRDQGQPIEARWPYMASHPPKKAWKPPSPIGLLFRRDGGPGGNTVDEIVRLLDLGQPVIVLLMLSPSFDSAGADGLVDAAPGEVPDYSRRHALIAVGYGHRTGTRVVLVRNSWGDDWGMGGYGWLTEPFLAARVFRLATLGGDLSVSRRSIAA
jgi:Papain family cysteine protease